MSIASRQDTETVPDLSLCEQEPIHIPGSIEPNGALLVVKEPELTIVQASANVEVLLDTSVEALLGAPLHHFLEADTLVWLQRRILPENLDLKRGYLSDIRLRNSAKIFDASVHRRQGLLILELEPSAASTAEEQPPGFYTLLTDAMADLDNHLSLVELCQRVAVRVRRLTGFDRVMIYKFLEDDSGSVIAEDRREDLTAYLGLRYPASDIPAQARRLYILNTLRLKADVNAVRAPLVPTLNPVTGQSLDMSYCILRAMSPVHVEYLRNMGVSASMSVSIVRDERLWGLIACHHTQPKIVPHRIRISCEALARVFSAHITAAEEEDRLRRSAGIREFRGSMEEHLRAGPEVRDTLIEHAERLMSAANSQGLAIFLGGEITLTGNTPPRGDVKRLLKWLDANQDQHIFYTEKLSDNYSAAQQSLPTASGLLSARIAMGGPDFLLWFRPRVVKVVEWGGNPAKPVEATETGKRISPRLSFERWKQTVGDRSEPWQDYEREYASALRQTVAEVLLLQRNLEVTHLNVELERSNIELDAFAYAASHDLQEPVRTMRSYAQLLVRRYGAKLDSDGLELIQFIETGAARMGNLISALLTYAQVGGSAKRERKAVSLEDVLRWVLMNLDELVGGSGATVTHDALPTVTADPEQLTQLLQNLVGNSIKYRRPDEPLRVHVSAAQQGHNWHFGVHDNGEGFAPEQSTLIFGAFKRLHGREIPGAGIGLALCKRIVEHHGGRIWAESKGKGSGAIFWFTLPRV